MKYLLSSILVLFMVSSLSLNAANQPIPDRVFTKQELSKYDGTNGNPAYVAIDGIVYDVTGVEAWKNGTHKGNKAGRDLSEEIKKSPHGKAVLTKRPAVGKLIAD